jgi:hypothetical protein
LLHVACKDLPPAEPSPILVNGAVRGHHEVLDAPHSERVRSPVAEPDDQYGG